MEQNLTMSFRYLEFTLFITIYTVSSPVYTMRPTYTDINPTTYFDSILDSTSFVFDYFEDIVFSNTNDKI